MSQAKGRMLEVEVLEDRCTPSTVGASDPSTVPLLPNGLPSAFASVLVLPNGGLTFGPLFNFAAPSPDNIVEFPTPASGLIARSDLIGGTLTGMFIPGIGPTAFDVANVEGIEARMPAGLQPSALGNLALGGLLDANPAGVPSIAAFPLAGYFDGLPLYDPDVPPPSNVDFESVSPFETSSMGRASYEGGDGAGATAGPAQAPAAPAAGPTSFDSSLDWFFSEAAG